MTYDPRALGARCDDCPLSSGKPVPPKRAVGSPKLIILAESPGETETELLEPLVGQTGQYVQEILDYFAVPIEAIHKTNAALCLPPDLNKDKVMKEAVECCAPRLKNELAEFVGSCRTILAYGNHAVKASIGGAKASDWFGPPASDGFGLDLGYRVVASFHPAFALPHRSPEFGGAVATFTERAWRDAHDLIPRWQWGQIVTDSAGDELILESIERLRAAPHLGIDVETTRPNKKREMHEFEQWSKKLYNIGAGSRRLGLSVSITWYKASSQVRSAMLRLLDSDIPKVMQWGNFDARIFSSNHIPLRNYAIDTGLLHSFTHPRQDHDLGYVSALEFENAPRWKDEWAAGKGKDKWDDPRYEAERAEYNAKDCIIQDGLADELGEHLRSVNNGAELFELAMKTWNIGIDMWRWGVHIDQEKLLALRGPILQAFKEAETRVVEMATRLGFDGTFRPHAKADIARVFEECLGSRSKRLTPTGATSYDEETLLRFKELGGLAGDFASALMDVRERHKRVQYVNDPPIWSDGRIHPQWAPQRAATLRWSCPGFPVQTIPKRSKEGKKLRQMFAPAPGKWFVCADFHQQEARFEALYSGEPELLEAFSKGVNPYSVVAAKLFGGRASDHGKGKPSYDAAKMTFLALIYGVGNNSLLEQLRGPFPKTTALQVAKLRSGFFSSFPIVSEYMGRIEKDAARNDFVEERISGYRYHYFGKFEPSHSLNFMNQAGGARLLNEAIVKIREQLGSDEEINLAVHDEIVLSGPDPYRLRSILRDCMVRSVEYDGRTMTFPVEISAGTTNWGELKEFEK